MGKRIFLIAVFLMASLFVFGEEVTLASTDWEPYIGAKIPNNGYVAQIAVEAFKSQGYTVKIEYLPWERAVQESTSGKYDGLFPEYYDESRKANFVYSEPFKGGPIGFMKRKDAKIDYKKLEDLKPYSIGVVRGYVNTAEFDTAKYLKKEEAVDDETNIKKLNAKRIDLIVIDKYVAYYIIANQFPKYRTEIEFIDPPLEEKSLYIAFPKKAKDYDKKLKAFNAGLKAIDKNGTLAKILKDFDDGN